MFLKIRQRTVFFNDIYAEKFPFIVYTAKMSDELCQAVSVGVLLLISLLTIIAVKTIFKKISSFLASRGIWRHFQSASVINLHREVGELRRATCQISQDWNEMLQLMASVHEKQDSFSSKLNSDLESRNKMLCQDIRVSLEQEYLRNDQQFTRVNRLIEALRSDFETVKDLVQKPAKAGGHYDPGDVVDDTTQTESELILRKRSRNGQVMPIGMDIEAGRSVAALVKKNVEHLMKEAKRHLMDGREEERKEFQAIFTRLKEDKEDIKNAVVRAFALASEQAKRNFDQFGNLGQDAMHYMAVLNDNTNKMLSLKLEETDTRLRELLNALNCQVFDVRSIKDTLDNIDAQLDEIFKRVELGCQKNSEHCEEIVRSLEATTEKWDIKASDLGEITRNFANKAEKMTGMLHELKGILTINTESISSKWLEVFSGNLSSTTLEITSQNSDNCLSNPNSDFVLPASINPDRLSLLSSMLQSCFDKFERLNNQIEDGTVRVQEIVKELVQKLESVNGFIDIIDQGIQNSNLSVTSKRTAAEARRNQLNDESMPYDAGDCVANSSPKLKKVSISSHIQKARRMQNAVAVGRVLKIIESYLKEAGGTEALSRKFQMISSRSRLENLPEDGKEPGSGENDSNEGVSCDGKT